MWIAVAARRRRTVILGLSLVTVAAAGLAAREVLPRAEPLAIVLNAATPVRVAPYGGASPASLVEAGAALLVDRRYGPWLGGHRADRGPGRGRARRVSPLGFRGEALPAIASVSRFELETSSDGHVATRLRVTGGKRESMDDAARQRGTTVTVRGLFFNTPARRKFLRAQATETRAAVEVVTLLALTRPDVAFTLTSDDRSLIDVRPTTRPIDRVHALWGPQLTGTLLPIAYREGPLEVRGFACAGR